jgi:pilus assembly protein CpaF
MTVTKALVQRFRAEVATELSERMRADQVDSRPRMALTDQRVFSRRLLNEALERYAKERLDDGQAPLSTEEELALAQAVQDSMFGGLGVLQRLLADDSVENIFANGCDQVWVHRADGSKARGPALADSDEELVEILRMAASRYGLSERRFDWASPELRLQLPDGSRLHAINWVSPRPCVSVRRHRFPDVDLDLVQRQGMIDRRLREFLSASVAAELNILICGETGAGKTHLMRALVSETPMDARIITVEKQLELGTHELPGRRAHVIPMEARPANIEGEGGIPMAFLVRQGLQMTPDRVLVGEVLGDEVVPMLHAMSQGNDGFMATIHSDSSRGAFSRVAMFALEAPEHWPLEATYMAIANSLHLVVFVRWAPDERGVDRRVVSSVREVTGVEDSMVSSTEVFAPGPTGLAEPYGPLERTVDRLRRVGYDTARLW